MEIERHEDAFDPLSSISFYQSKRSQIPDWFTNVDLCVDFELTMNLIMSNCYPWQPLGKACPLKLIVTMKVQLRKLHYVVVIWFQVKVRNCHWSSVQEFLTNHASITFFVWLLRHSRLDDLLKFTVAWETFAIEHLEFISHKLWSWKMKYWNQSSIWITVNLSKSYPYFGYAVDTFSSCYFQS